jgi:hypothetical protein
MSGLNGVHTLLAFLTQQAQLSKFGNGSKIDVKQLDSLHQESRLLNERLLRIETILAISNLKNSATSGVDPNQILKVEGNWPAASTVRDVINSQERQQAVGYWQSEQVSTVDTEPYSYRESHVEQPHMNVDPKQLLIQRYTPTEFEQADSKPGVNFGLHRVSADDYVLGDKNPSGDGGRLLLVSVGFALLLFALFSLIN